MRSRPLARLAAGALLVALLALARVSRASPPGAPSEPLPLAETEATLARDARASQTWYFGWTSFYAASTSVSTVLAVVATDEELRASSRVNAVKSGLGFLATLVLPPPSILHAPCPAEELATAAGRDACAARQRARLEDAAGAERFGRSWLAHAAAATVNLAGGLYLWLHDDQLRAGIVTTVVGVVVSEVQILTHPTTARDAAPGAARLRVPDVSVGVLRGGAVLSLGAAF